MSNQKPILFFDGVCHLCNGFIDEMLRRDRKRRLQFASLQGETAQELLSSKEREGLPSVILLLEGKKFYASDAVLKLMLLLGGWHMIFAALYLIPRALRNWLYRQIANRRYLWFGQRDQCRLPTAEERDRLLP